MNTLTQDGFTNGQLLVANQNFRGYETSIWASCEPIWFKEGDLFMVHESFARGYYLNAYSSNGEIIKNNEHESALPFMLRSARVGFAELPFKTVMKPLVRSGNLTQEKHQDFEAIIALKDAQNERLNADITKLQASIKESNSVLKDELSLIARGLASSSDYDHKTKNEHILRAISRLLSLLSEVGKGENQEGGIPF